MTPKVPTFAYPGGKVRMAKSIASVFPPTARYVEPFAGRGAVYFYVAAHGMFPSYWINDLRTFPFFNGLKHSGIYATPQRSRSSYEKMRDRNRGNVGGKRVPISYPPAPILAPLLTFSGGGYDEGGYRKTTGGPNRESYIRTVKLAATILNTTDTRITRLDYRDVLKECGPDDLVYLDPPYMDCNVVSYGPDDLNHQEMVAILKEAKFKWVLSEYEQPIYDDAFGEPIRIGVQRTMDNANMAKRKKAVECLWKNF